MILLIYPPLSKPCEIPVGVLKLASALAHHKIKTEFFNANLEGIHFLLTLPPKSCDTWTRRAVRHIDSNLAALGTINTYANRNKYGKAVMDLNRVMAMTPSEKGIHMSLSNYQDDYLSPLRSSDLLQSYKNPERNPFFPMFKKRLLSILTRTSPSAIGLSLIFLSQALTTFAMIGFIKREAPEIKIILGGGLVTSWLRNPEWNNPFAGIVDIMIGGPGEIPLLKYCGIPHPQDYYTVDYHLFPSTQYFSPGFILPYSASTGCYWNRCAFCPERVEQNPYKPVFIPRVIKELTCAQHTTKPALIHFLDTAIRPELFRAIASDLPPIPWYGFARISRILSDFDFCIALKRSGCVMLQLGIESGDEEVLENMGKGVSLDMITLVLANLKKAGIATYGYLLFGTIWETEEKARRTLEFTVKHADTIDFLNCAIFNLPAHSPETALLDIKDFYDADLSLYKAFNHPKGWDRSKVRVFIEREFKKHPLIAPIVRREPFIFTSNHAPFFAMAQQSICKNC